MCVCVCVCVWGGGGIIYGGQVHDLETRDIIIIYLDIRGKVYKYTGLYNLFCLSFYFPLLFLLFMRLTISLVFIIDSEFHGSKYTFTDRNTNNRDIKKRVDKKKNNDEEAEEEEKH